MGKDLKMWEDRSWQVPYGWSSEDKGGRGEVGMGSRGDMGEIWALP